MSEAEGAGVVTRLELEGHELWVASGWDEVLRSDLAPHLRAAEEAAGAQVVKQNRVRTVVRLQTSRGEVFWKRFRVKKAFDRLLHAIKPSPARREWRGLRALAEAGLEVPQPLWFGEERSGGVLVGSTLATLAVPGARELTEVVDALRAAEGQESVRKRLVAKLASVVRAMFAAGADLPDLPLGNFLVRPLEAPAEGSSELKNLARDVEQGSLVALDLHSLRIRSGPLSRARRRLRLEKLAHSFGVCNPDHQHEGRRELSWFCEAYVALDPEQGAASAFALALQLGANRLEARRLKSRDRRCLVDSTSFAVEQRGERVIYRRREVPTAALLAAIEAEPEAVIHAHPHGRSRLVRVARPEGFPGSGPLVVKHYSYPKLRKRLAAVIGPLALRAWRAARACEVRHAPVPAHYGLVLEGRAWPRGAALVLELLADVTMIHVLLQEEGIQSPASRRALARAVGKVMGRFHGSGLIHRDLAVQNILVRPKGDAANPDWDVWVIDLDEVRTGVMDRKAKLRALIQLADLPTQATRSDRLRFFRAYLAEGGRSVLAPELQAWGERGLGGQVGEGLAKRAAAKARRMARSGHAQPEPTDLATLATAGQAANTAQSASETSLAEAGPFASRPSETKTGDSGASASETATGSSATVPSETGPAATGLPRASSPEASEGSA